MRRTIDDDTLSRQLGATSFHHHHQKHILVHPPAVSRKEACRKFFYDKDEKTICHKKGEHWRSLFFYYLIFILALLGIFISFFFGVKTWVTTTKHLPPIKKISIFESPGITIMPVRINPYGEPIIWYTDKGPDTLLNRRVESYINYIKKYFEWQMALCHQLKVRPCTVNLTEFGPCGKHPYGYTNGKLCVYVKMNTMEEWSPQHTHMSSENVRKVPKDIASRVLHGPRLVCIHCEGKTKFDKEKIGEIIYYPGQCFKKSYFPFMKGPRNINPVIGIHLPNIFPGYIVKLNCKVFGSPGMNGEGVYQAEAYIYVAIEIK